MKQQVFIRTSIIGGVSTGISTFLLMLLFHLIGLRPLGKQFFLFLPMYAACMMLVVTWYRNYKNAGILQGFHALVMTFIINLLGSLFYATSLYLFLRFGSDEMLNLHHIDLLNLLKDNKDILVKDRGIELYEQNLAAIQQVTPSNIATDTLLKTSLGGFFVAFIVALGLRKAA